MTEHEISMPDPDDPSAIADEVEAYLAEQYPDDFPTVTTPAAADEAETRQVKRLRREVAEARLLADLQDDDTPLMLDSPKVRKRRKAAYEAARLHTLAQDPMMRAWQASRMRKVFTATALVSLTLALGWSTAGVQLFASEGAAAWSPAWCFAWLVEPFMSLALLTVVGAKAYLAVRGQPIVSGTLTKIEALFLSLTLGMNAWPHLPGIAAHFKVSGLVLHLLGPVVAVAIVAALPLILDGFARLDHGTSPTLADLRRDRGRETSPETLRDTPTRGRSIAEHRAELHRLIEAGALPAQPSAEQIRRTLRCSRAVAQQLRDETQS